MRKTKTLALLLGTMTATACGDDGGTAIDTEGGTTGGPTTSTTASSTMTTTLTTGVDTTATTGVDTTDAETGCMGECQVDGDCAAGQSCISCICVGETVCEQWGSGVFGDCVEDDGTINNQPCMDANAVCLVDDTDPGEANLGVCFFQGCTTPCDCPQPPEGFEEQVVCEQIAGDMQLDCAIECGPNDECPDGMTCFGGLCYHGEPPPGLPPYSDCVNESGLCEDGLCLVDVNPPNEGVCAPNCTMDSDCPAPATGDSVPVCSEFGMDNTPLCELPCDNGETCPDDMVCGTGGWCTWEVIVPEPPSYQDCANNPPETCLANEECTTATIGNNDYGVCSLTGCTDAMDCPEAPATGDAPVTCGDLGNGNVCHLDCSNNETCPDGMECTTDGYCSWLAAGFLLNEDFETGFFRPGWTLINNDMLTPNAQVDFVTDAWVISDILTMDNLGAISTSYYNPAGQADDWMITPQLTLSASSVLAWESFASDAMFPDGYEVVIATGNTVTDLMAGDVVFTVDDDSDTLMSHMVDLATYDGQTVYIAFHNNSNDEYLLFVDNITVTP